MDTLREVKSYMDFWGWTNGGNPGAVKHDLEGHVIASHGDLIWVQDVEKACDTIKRLAELAERAASPA